MIPRPAQIGTFEFVILASLRAAQLTRGCLSKVDGQHKATVRAQIEVSEGMIGPLVSAGNGADTKVSSDGLRPVMSDEVKA